MPFLPVLLTLFLAAALLPSAIGKPSNFGNCISTTDKIYHLPSTPLAALNPWLRNDSHYQALLAVPCSPTAPSNSVCSNQPAIGSGLTQLSKKFFLGLTDRGPTVDCPNPNDINFGNLPDSVPKSPTAFLLPALAPTILHFKLDETNNALKPLKYVPLRGVDGKPISGLPNSPADDIPFTTGCLSDPLPFDPSGLDTEDIARIPNTNYVAIVDEYSPSVIIANYETGNIIARHVPSSLSSALDKARYPIIPDIPDIYKKRRVKRGFEAIVVDKDGKYVIAILQAPMLGDDETKTSNNAIIRCAYFDLSISNQGLPSLRYSKTFTIEASSPAAYENQDNQPRDMKYSAAQYLAKDRFLALERATGQVKIFLVDFSKATNLDNTKYSDNLGLEEATNGIYLAKQVGVTPAEKTLVWDSAHVVGGSSNFMGTSKQEGIALDVSDPTKIWMINDNDFGVEGSGNTALHKISLGRSAKGATVCEPPAHPPSPRIDARPNKSLRLTNSKTYRISKVPDAGAAENLDVDEDSSLAYVSNAESGSLDVYDISKDPDAPIFSYVPDGATDPTSTAVCKAFGIVAVAFAEDNNGIGRIDVLNKDMSVFRKIRNPNCILPDHILWSNDCKFLVAACEGEGAGVPGGVLVADFGGPSDNRFRGVKVADFKRYNGLADKLKENGIHFTESNVPSKDLEPEYVAISGKNAFVTIQEANAIAVVDMYEGKITELKPIGFIDRSRPGFGLDASDKDGKINIRNYPLLYGMPQPDAMVSYVAADGETYLIFANEGDAKDAEEARGGDITDPDELNRRAASGLKELVEDETALGRLTFSTVMGYNLKTNMQEKMFHFGSRSFSIMALNGSIVFDSGEWFARIQENMFPIIFNSNDVDSDDLERAQADLFDNR